MMINCFYCNEASGIALLGQIKPAVKKSLAEAGVPVGPDGDAPRRGVVVDSVPCHKCKEYMEMGIILISIDDVKTDDPKNPYRTGGWCVVKEEFVTRNIKPELAEIILEHRVAFVPDALWDEIKLPREPLKALH